jgi:hypothetical protein
LRRGFVPSVDRKAKKRFLVPVAFPLRSQS